MPLDLKIPKYGQKSSGQYYYSGASEMYGAGLGDSTITLCRASERYGAGPANSTSTLEQVRGFLRKEPAYPNPSKKKRKKGASLLQTE